MNRKGVGQFYARAERITVPILILGSDRRKAYHRNRYEQNKLLKAPQSHFLRPVLPNKLFVQWRYIKKNGVKIDFIAHFGPCFRAN